MVAVTCSRGLIKQIMATHLKENGKDCIYIPLFQSLKPLKGLLHNTSQLSYPFTDIHTQAEAAKVPPAQGD